ncbi:hypothetical protein HOLleu_21454 [Holothuria leucospilota]|uniref:Uncharacterized protein n=1 Tax=Holothuria leucospilota TaxID=206669 RepID=A0A9Q1BXY8_HOLLE|nr:hypothetical protein HOLleu_21454 [Holothuria leucospilota]
MSRRTQTLLPTTQALLQPKVIENVTKENVLRRQKTKAWYDQAAKPLPELQIGQPVRMKPATHDQPWRRGTCVSQLNPRSYIVEVDGQLYRRNRKHLKPSSEPPATETPTLPDDDQIDSSMGSSNIVEGQSSTLGTPKSVKTRAGREVKFPKEKYKDFEMK